MPWFRLYLIDRDVEDLCRMLNDDAEIALIRPAGAGRWKAQRDVPKLPDGEHILWHIPSGPIVLESRKIKGPTKIVKNPFRGWTELDKPVNAGVPWFGPAPLGIIRLTIRRKTQSRPVMIGLSTIHWVGNYFRDLRGPGGRATTQWWKTLGRRIAKMSTRISSDGPLMSNPPDVWAFDHALKKIKAGAKRADNPG